MKIKRVGKTKIAVWAKGVDERSGCEASDVIGDSSVPLDGISSGATTGVSVTGDGLTRTNEVEGSKTTSTKRVNRQISATVHLAQNMNGQYRTKDAR